jgi:hypothetical protein
MRSTILKASRLTIIETKQTLETRPQRPTTLAVAPAASDVVDINTSKICLPWDYRLG